MDHVLQTVMVFLVLLEIATRVVLIVLGMGMWERMLGCEFLENAHSKLELKAAQHLQSLGCP